jgi:hypothetical protein
MKNLTLLFLSVITILISLSCNVEKRIKKHSYTKEWHYHNNQRYQVYRTRLNRKYIIILNKKENKQKRYYIKHGR